MVHILSYREQETRRIDGACHGDAGKKRGHHDDFCGEILMVVEFDGVKHGIDRSRNGSHDENRLGDDGRKRMSCQCPYIDQRPRAGRA